MRPTESLEALVEILGTLQDRGLVRLLPPTPGRRAQLYDHLLYPEDEIADPPVEEVHAILKSVPSPPRDEDLDELRLQLEDLTRRVSFLERELDLCAPLEDDGDSTPSP